MVLDIRKYIPLNIHIVMDICNLQLTVLRNETVRIGNRKLGSPAVLENQKLVVTE